MDNIALDSIVLKSGTAPMHGERSINRAHNERTAGAMPSWDRVPAPKTDQSFDNVLSAYRPVADTIEMAPISKGEEEFGFWDIVDMVNPLQHVPLVNLVYRGITGDEIKPASQIIGGGIFGGPVGVASGLVNAVIEAETGKDMLGNVTALAGVGKQQNDISMSDYSVEQRAYEDLPIALLSFAEMPVAAFNDMETAGGDSHEDLKSQPDYERVRIASGRTAGTIAVYA